MSYTPRLQEKYKNEIVQVLKEKFNYKSVMEVPKVEKIVIKLNEHNFINIKIMETLNREWIVDKKIVRPKNEMVGHTGFVVSARFLSN